MWVKTIALENVKGFIKTGEIKLSRKVSVLIGQNNSGKSTILRSLYLLQPVTENYGNAAAKTFLRTGEANFSIKMQIEERQTRMALANETWFGNERWDGRVVFEGHSRGVNCKVALGGGSPTVVPEFLLKSEPYNFIYPFFSRRKPNAFRPESNKEIAESVAEDLGALPAKIDRCTKPHDPDFEEFRCESKRILDLDITAFQKQGGIGAGLLIDRERQVELAAMGEGTVQLLGLIVSLCGAEGKLFLIEEIENDIHPGALKKLLELIIRKSDTNQFVVSTHSNIVAKYLGSVPGGKLFKVRMETKDRVPTSTIEEVEALPEARIEVLRELGYDMLDFDLWSGYLVLEESTAERIIKDLLIPWFARGLTGRIRTISANGISKVEPAVDDFCRLFVFIHQADAYKEKAWVFVDGDAEGKATIEELKKRFKTWPQEHFRCFGETSFERYYPKRFNAEVEAALKEPDKAKKREAKKKLVESVVKWAEKNEAEAKAEFESSAAEVIRFLCEIEKALC